MRQGRVVVTVAFLVIAGSAACIGVFGSWYTVDQGDRAVILRNGEIIGVADPGFHFKAPIFDEVVDMSVRTERGTFETSAYSNDRQTASLTITVNYRADASRVADIYEKYSTAYVDRIVRPRVEAQSKVVFGRYTAERAISERGELNREMAEQIKSAIEPYGLIVEDVQVEGLSFSAEYNAAIEDRMRAQVEVDKLRENLERERVQAEIARTQAQAQADSNLAKAKAEAEATALRGQAEAESIKARGAALRDNPGLIGLITAERWNGILPTTMVPGSTVPFMSLPDGAR